MFFHKIEGRDTLSRSHNNLNTTHRTESLSAIELCNVGVGVEISFGFFIYNFLIMLGQTHEQ
jgi:hypothetical protein